MQNSHLFQLGRHSSFACVAMLLLLALGRADAAEELADHDTTYPDISIHGFGTLGAIYHDKKHVDFRRRTGQLEGADAGEVSFAQDSMLGVQLTAQLNESVEATIQGIARQNTEGNYRPKTTWAFVKYSPNQNFFARAGRIGYDIFLGSDTADIDYAQLEIRRPIFFYPGGFDGVDAELMLPWQDGTFHFKGYYGESFNKRIEHGPESLYDVSGSRVFGAFVQYDWDDWSARLSAGRLLLNNENPVLARWRSQIESLPNGAKIVDFVSIADRPFDHLLLAVAYDGGPWRGAFNYGGFFSPGWPTRVVMQTDLGYRLGNITPYVSYSDEHMSRGTIPTGIPNGRSPLMDSFNYSLAYMQNAFIFNQSDLSVGVRYDVAPNVALKLQLDRIRYQDPDAVVDSTLGMTDIESRGHRSFTLFSAALNFVF